MHGAQAGHSRKQTETFTAVARRLAVGALVGALAAPVAGCEGGVAAGADPDDAGLSRRELLGKRLFFDASLSEPSGLACGTCHDPRRAFSGNNGSAIGVPFGSRPGVLGLRNTPTAMYASFAPAFELVAGAEGVAPTGGQFLDGRAASLTEQAKRPFLSDLEMNNADAAAVVAKVARSKYAALFEQEWGAGILSRRDEAFDAIAASIAAFESTERFHPFNSRYDRYVRGVAALSAQEARGLALFLDPQKGNCVACHAADPKSHDPRDSLFTDFTYDNLGVPRNAGIPANADPEFFDLGLCGPQRTSPTADSTQCGAFKVPTLRNVARKQAFMHNGYFRSLRDVVAFYAKRDTDPGRWYPGGAKFDDLPPAYRGNVNVAEVPYDRRPGAAPRLTDSEIDDLTAFLRALNDD